MRKNPKRADAAVTMLEEDPSPVESCPGEQWWVLITQAEWVRATTGRGLANVWGAIHRDDYPTARRLLDEQISFVDHGDVHVDVLYGA